MKDSELIEKLLKGFDQITVAATYEDAYDIACEMLELEPKPRTKTEFVKCEFNYAWEAVKEHEESKNIFHCNEGGEYAICGYDIHIIGECVNDGEIYRKVETEIDERQEFIDTYNELRREFKLQHKVENFHNFLFDSGRFKLVDGK